MSSVTSSTSSVQQTETFRFTCANPACKKGYNTKEFSCYNMDFCSSKCMYIVVTPLREEEARKREEAEKKKQRFNHIGYGGGYAH